MSGVSEIAVEIECLLADGGGTWEVVRDAHLGAGETSYAVSNLTAGTYRIRVSAVGGTYLATYSPEFTLVAGQHKSGFAVALASTVPVVNPPVPPAVVRHATSVKVKAKGAKKKATLTVSVAAAGVPVSAVGGKVVVYAKGKKVKTVSLKKGKVKVVVKKQKKGKIAYTVKYLGNSSLLPSAKIVKVKVK